MKIDAKNFAVYCDEKNKGSAERLLQILSSHGERILEFFKLSHIEEKAEIIIYSDIEEYAAHVNRCGQEYYDWMIADTFDGKINIVSVDICRKTESHRNISDEEYAKLIIHEFVHICQQAVNPDCNGCIWFWEALATNLSGQKIESPRSLCTEEELIFHYTELPEAYSISCFLGQYMLKNLTYEQIYEYIKNPELLRNDAGDILKAAAMHN